MINRIEWATNLIQDDTFKEIVKNLEDIQINRFVNSSFDHIDEREDAYCKLAGIRSFVSHIESLAATKEIVNKRWKIW